uniref:Transposase n=1 Tax=Macrostomum lignano TaxID=282301 RepID=A0A1I8H9V9_9PLAT
MAMACGWPTGQTKALLAHYWSRLPQGAVARLAELHSRPAEPPTGPSSRCAGGRRCTTPEVARLLGLRALLARPGAAHRTHAGYSLTHQLFYLMNGVQAGCLSNLTAQARATLPPAPTAVGLAGVFDNFLRKDLQTAGFPKPDRDLFMRAGGSLWAWRATRNSPDGAGLPVLLSWQRANGCFGEFPGELINPSNFDPGLYGNYKRRRKRAEMRMPEGCLSHRTSVAIAGLTAYCRRLVETLAN